MFEEREHEKEKRGEYFQDSLNVQLEKMESNKRSFLGITIENSKSYDKVKEKLQILTDSLNKQIYNKADDAEEKSYRIQDMYAKINENYDELCVSCGRYLDAHSGIRWTSSGRARRSLIEEIYDQAVSERERLSQLGVRGVQEVYGHLSEVTFNDILKDLRTEVIDITGREDIENFGGKLSSGVAIGDGEDKRFFKPKEVVYGPSSNENLMNFLKRKYLKSEEIKAWDKGVRCTQQESLNRRSCVLREYNRIKELRMFTNRTACIPFDARIDIRNVATSRLSEALGEPDLVAKSRLAVLREEGVPDKEGIIMAKAKGKSSQQLSKDLRFFTEQSVMGQGIYQIRLSKDVQRKFANLQLLDYIAAQMDRHEGNYFVDYEILDMGGGVVEFYITSIQGIDNDLSFGLRNINELFEGKYLLPKFNDLNGYLSLPYIDKGFYNRLREFQNLGERGVMSYIFADLLTPEEMDALQDRFERVKVAVFGIYSEDGILDSNGWDQTSLDATLKADNYLSRFINYVRKFIRSDVPIVSD